LCKTTTKNGKPNNNLPIFKKFTSGIGIGYMKTAKINVAVKALKKTSPIPNFLLLLLLGEFGSNLVTSLTMAPRRANSFLQNE